MTEKTLFILMTCLVFSCKDKCNGVASKTQATNKIDKLYRDSEDNSVTILFEGKYIFNIKIDSTFSKDNKYISWTGGLYKIYGDTLYIYIPEYNSREFRTIKNQFFYADTTGEPVTLNLCIPSEKLANSLLHQKCIDCLEMVSHYNNGKAILSKDKITFLR